MKTIGMIGGSYNPLHNGHIKCINKALEYCDVLHIIVGDLPNRDEFDINTKLHWFQTVFHNEIEKGSIILHPLLDDTTNKVDYDLNKWISDSKKIKEIIQNPIDVVFCGADYHYDNNPYEICYPEAKIIYFDRGDLINSTDIRNDFRNHKNWIPQVVFDDYKQFYGRENPLL